MLRAVLTLLPMLCPGVTCSPSDAMHRRRGHFQTPFRPYPGWTNGESWGASATSTGQKLLDHGCPSLCLSSCNYFEPCRAASWRSAVARHSWTLHWPWYVNYLLWSQRAHYGLCGAWGAFGLAQFYRLQLARLINLQPIAHYDYTVTLPPSISTGGGGGGGGY